MNYAAVTGIAMLATDATLTLWLGNTVQLLALGQALGSFKVQRLPVAFAGLPALLLFALPTPGG